MSKTISELAQEMERALDELRSVRHLPQGLEGLRWLVPPDSHPRVTLHKQGNRKIRGTASARYFDPGECEVHIRFEPIETETASEIIAELIESLDLAERQQAERGGFVGLKWFRDQFLPTRPDNWAKDSRTCGGILRQATDSSLILTSQVPNPKNPLHPVSAIRLNRSHPDVRTTDRPTPRRRFKPVKIRGEALSRTVLGARR